MQLRTAAEIVGGRLLQQHTVGSIPLTDERIQQLKAKLNFHEKKRPKPVDERVAITTDEICDLARVYNLKHAQAIREIARNTEVANWKIRNPFLTLMEKIGINAYELAVNEAIIRERLEKQQAPLPKAESRLLGIDDERLKPPERRAVDGNRRVVITNNAVRSFLRSYKGFFGRKFRFGDDKERNERLAHEHAFIAFVKAYQIGKQHRQGLGDIITRAAVRKPRRKKREKK